MSRVRYEWQGNRLTGRDRLDLRFQFNEAWQCQPRYYRQQLHFRAAVAMRLYFYYKHINCLSHSTNSTGTGWQWDYIYNGAASSNKPDPRTSIFKANHRLFCRCAVPRLGGICTTMNLYTSGTNWVKWYYPIWRLIGLESSFPQRSKLLECETAVCFCYWFIGTKSSLTTLDRIWRCAFQWYWWDQEQLPFRALEAMSVAIAGVPLIGDWLRSILA